MCNKHILPIISRNKKIQLIATQRTIGKMFNMKLNYKIAHNAITRRKKNIAKRVQHKARMKNKQHTIGQQPVKRKR